MRVRLVYIGRIRTTVGSKEETLEVSPGTTVGDLLQELAARHGSKFSRQVFDDGGLATGLNVLVDGLNVTSKVFSKGSEEAAKFPEKETGETEVELVLLDAPPSGG